MDELVGELRTTIATVKEGGGEVARQRHLARGKLLPRQRIDGLIDPGTPFLELSPLAGHEMYGKDKVPAGGVVDIPPFSVAVLDRTRPQSRRP